MNMFQAADAYVDNPGPETWQRFCEACRSDPAAPLAGMSADEFIQVMGIELCLQAANFRASRPRRR